MVAGSPCVSVSRSWTMWGCLRAGSQSLEEPKAFSKKSCYHKSIIGSAMPRPYSFKSGRRMSLWSSTARATQRLSATCQKWSSSLRFLGFGPLCVFLLFVELSGCSDVLRFPTRGSGQRRITNQDSWHSELLGMVRYQNQKTNCRLSISACRGRSLCRTFMATRSLLARCLMQDIG